MQKLLIADSSEIFISALEEKLNQDFLICTCGDGNTLTELLSDYQPDVLIMNLMLPYTDGITALQKSCFHPPVILAIAMHMSAYVERTVIDLGIDYTMIAPSVDAVVLRLRDLMRSYSTPVDTADIHSQVRHHLHLLNIPTHLDGYRQLSLALPLFAANPQQRITKELYPAVAHSCGCTDGRSVEHSIRKAICAAWKHRDNAIWRKYFGLGSQGTVSCPTNKEFLCRLAELLNESSYIF